MIEYNLITHLYYILSFAVCLLDEQNQPEVCIYRLAFIEKTVFSECFYHLFSKTIIYCPYFKLYGLILVSG